MRWQVKLRFEDPGDKQMRLLLASSLLPDLSVVIQILTVLSLSLLTQDIHCNNRLSGTLSVMRWDTHTDSAD